MPISFFNCIIDMHGLIAEAFPGLKDEMKMLFMEQEKDFPFLGWKDMWP